MDILQLVRSVRRFAQQFAYDLPGQQFVERVAAAREVPCLLVSHYSIHPSPSLQQVQSMCMWHGRPVPP